MNYPHQVLQEAGFKVRVSFYEIVTSWQLGLFHLYWLSGRLSLEQAHFLYVATLDPCVDNLSLTYKQLSSFVIEICLFNEDKTNIQV